MIWYPHDVLFCNFSLGWYFLLYALSANYPTFFGSLISHFPYMLFRHFLYGFAMVPFFSTNGITTLHVQFSFVDSVKCYVTCMNCYQCFLHMFIVCSYFNCTHTPLSIIGRSGERKFLYLFEVLLLYQYWHPDVLSPICLSHFLYSLRLKTVLFCNNFLHYISMVVQSCKTQFRQNFCHPNLFLISYETFSTEILMKSSQHQNSK